MQTLISQTIKPIKFLHSYSIKDEVDSKKLQKLRLHPKNLELDEYKIRKNKWVRTKIPIKYNKTCFSHLKGLNSFLLPQVPSKTFRLFQSQKQIFVNLRKLSVNIGIHIDKKNLRILEKSLIKMKHLKSFTDYNKEISPKDKCFAKVKYLGQMMESLELPCHLMIKHLDGLKELTIDVEKLENIAEIVNLPGSLRVLNVVDRNPLDKGDHVEAFNIIKEQINSLKNLKNLNLIFPEKSYFAHDLFSVLEGNGIEVCVRAKIDYEDGVLEEMEKYVERTSSHIRIIPSGYSDAGKYMRFLDFLLKRDQNGMIKLERLIYPFNAEVIELQNKVKEYYKLRTEETKQVEFLLEFDMTRGWYEPENLNNFYEMFENIIDDKVKIIYHLTYLEHKGQEGETKTQIRDAAILLLLDKKLKEMKQEKTIKVTSNVFGFEIIKLFIQRLFLNPYKVERIDWVNFCSYIAGLPETLNDLRDKQNIKGYSLVTHQ